MSIKHSRGPPWDFPEWVYDLVEWSVVLILAGVLLFGAVSAVGSFTDHSSFGPPNREGAYSVTYWDRDNRPMLTRVLL